jgi:hypothetical protein
MLPTARSIRKRAKVVSFKTFLCVLLLKSYVPAIFLKNSIMKSPRKNTEYLIVFSYIAHQRVVKTFKNMYES